MYPNLNSKNNIASMGQFPRLISLCTVMIPYIYSSDILFCSATTANGTWTPGLL